MLSKNYGNKRNQGSFRKPTIASATEGSYPTLTSGSVLGVIFRYDGLFVTQWSFTPYLDFCQLIPTKQNFLG